MQAVARGQLRIYLGAAPGVGKTYAMLSEGVRRRTRGADVVIAYVETHGRAETAAQLGDLPIVARRRIDYRGSTLEEMDLAAVLARAPDVALVDELAHTNVPGAGNHKRWEDIEQLLAAGITVISTLNVQHLESLGDVVTRITGVVQRETVPDNVVRAAEQIELVDMTPEALRRRMAHGNIYPPDKLDTALASYFRHGNLAALRELALLWVAGRADEEMLAYRQRHGIDELWETRERIVVGLAGAPGEERLIRRAARMGDRLTAAVIGVHVRTAEGLLQREPEALESHRRLLAELGCSYAEVASSDVSGALLQFARSENATQIVLGDSHRPAWRQLLRPPAINRIVRDSAAIDVHVISLARAGHSGLPQAPSRHRPASVPARRRAAAWLLGTAGVALLAAAISPLQPAFGLPGALLCLLVAVVAVAGIGGAPPAIAATLIAALGADYFFVAPFHSFLIDSAANAVAVIMFFVLAGLVAALVDRLIRSGLQMARAQAESEALARLVSGLDPLSASRLPRLVDELRRTFNLEMVAVLSAQGELWTPIASSGRPVPSRPEHAQYSTPLDDHTEVVFAGETLNADDTRLLQAFVAALRQAQEEATLAREAAQASALAAANRLRTALLAAVSHDFRTPLHAIKAAATSMVSDEVDWSSEQMREFSQTIDAETDRLSSLVDNLLDMTRLQTGALPISVCASPVEDVLLAALASLPDSDGRVTVQLGSEPLTVQTDPGLLERAVANVVANALAVSTEGFVVRVEGGVVKDRIELRVIDRGPGVPPPVRDQLFKPFHSAQDRPDGARLGVGLGLAIAKGFVEAMGGELSLEDTPGGGATFVFALPRPDFEELPISDIVNDSDVRTG